jgi:hypothetical protein
VQAGALYGCDLVVRYFIDEAASGTAPAELLDAAPEPFDLPLTYGGVMQYTEQVGHRGLRWTAAGEDDGAFAAVAGTKVFDLDGSTVGTIEVVADIDQVTYLGTRLAHIGGGVDSGLTMASSFSWVRGEPEVADATRVEIRTGYSDRVVTSYFQVNLFRLGRVVLHAVVDTSASAVEDRTRLYLNGVRIPLDSFNDAIEPAQGAPAGARAAELARRGQPRHRRSLPRGRDLLRRLLRARPQRGRARAQRGAAADPGRRPAVSARLPRVRPW